mmetsp:Transcript_47871/g.74739  ORF Transcript_47871/g.74739 Transcript_47871/m.74739 type:complete len:265 (-) Transcript_47871:3364-4158(-)
MQASGRFLAVAGALATVGALCFFALAADQASSLGADELIQKQSADSEKVTIKRLGALLKQQSAEDVEAAKLFAQIKEEAAAKLKAKPHASLKASPHKEPAMLRDIPKGAVSLSATSSSNLGGKPESKVAQLKAELAKAEAQEKAKKEAAAKAKKSVASTTAHSTPAKAQAAVKKTSLVTAKDFKSLKGHKALKEDKSIAKEAGLKAMDWMGSKSKVDQMLKHLHCDPTSFVCTGTKDEKKKAVSLIMQIQKSIMDDGKQVPTWP